MCVCSRSAWPRIALKPLVGMAATCAASMITSVRSLTLVGSTLPLPVQSRQVISSRPLPRQAGQLRNSAIFLSTATSAMSSGTKAFTSFSFQYVHKHAQILRAYDCQHGAEPHVVSGVSRCGQGVVHGQAASQERLANEITLPAVIPVAGALQPAVPPFLESPLSFLSNGNNRAGRHRYAGDGCVGHRLSTACGQVD